MFDLGPREAEQNVPGGIGEQLTAEMLAALGAGAHDALDRTFSRGRALRQPRRIGRAVDCRAKDLVVAGGRRLPKQIDFGPPDSQSGVGGKI